MFYKIALFLQNMKKVLFLLILILIVIVFAGCNKEVCPAYTDSANKMRNSVFQKGSVRADGIHLFYRDSPKKR
jgi:hypothetical protein